MDESFDEIEMHDTNKKRSLDLAENKNSAFWKTENLSTLFLFFVSY